MNAELRGYVDAIQAVRLGRRALARRNMGAAIVCLCEANRLRSWACGYAYGSRRSDDVSERRRHRVYATILAFQDDLAAAVCAMQAIATHQERVANRGRHGHA